ncbi:Splicing factor arginine/serine-rich 19 [Dissostichus eleginoides]|uniref:Splicing factor arginine/serine-rich 19 n=1 Tax=Dissostichus eleginoides TaxID=100907 RepID=A0AAD9EU29_DISEL|nr:Splicing factor arginine/serine-rich 19 [Dissostichus eleginoides]
MDLSPASGFKRRPLLPLPRVEIKRLPGALLPARHPSKHSLSLTTPNTTSLEALHHASVQPGVDCEEEGKKMDMYDPFNEIEGVKGEEGEKYDPFDPTGSPESDPDGIAKVRGVKRNAERGDEEGEQKEEPPDSTYTLADLQSPRPATRLPLRRRVDCSTAKAGEHRESAESDHSEIEEGEIVGATDRNGNNKRPTTGEIIPLNSPSVSFFGSKPERILRVLDGDGFVSVCTESSWDVDMEPEDEPVVGVEDLRRKLDHDQPKSKNRKAGEKEERRKKSRKDKEGCRERSKEKERGHKSGKEDSDKPHKRKKKRKWHSAGEMEEQGSCHSQSQSLSPPRYQSYESDHYSDKLEIDVLSLDGEALDSDYPYLEDTPPAALPPEQTIAAPKLKLSPRLDDITRKRNLTSGLASTSSGLPSTKRARKVVKAKNRDKSSRKDLSHSGKSKKESGVSRKGKLQSKVSVLVREGVSSTTGASVGSGKLGMDLIGPGGTGGGTGSSVVGGSIAVVFCRDNESRSPFLKPCSEPLSRSKDMASMGKRSSLAAPQSSLSSPSGLKSKKTKGAGVSIALSTPTAKPPSLDVTPKPLASPPCSSSTASCGPTSISLPLSSADPSSSSVSSSSASKPHPPPPESSALPWSLQTGVDCTTGGVLALTALLFKMEEANIASRAKAQEFIQATSQILSQANQSQTQQLAPPSSASSSQIPPPPSLPPHSGPSPAQFILHSSKTPPPLLQPSMGGGCGAVRPHWELWRHGWDLESKDPDKYLKKLHTQERAVEEVKLAIKPYYQRKDINKDEYKDILRKAVHKICHSRTGEINPVKVSNLVKLYVQRYKYFRKHGRKMDEEEREDREPGAVYSSA